MTATYMGDALADSGYLYMLFTVLGEASLIAVLVWLVRMLISHVKEADRVAAAAESHRRRLGSPGPDFVRNRMRVLRGSRLPGDPDKVAEFQRIIRVNGLKRHVTPQPAQESHHV